MNYKIKVHNEKHSEAIQEALFERGCSWGLSGAKLQELESKHLYINDCKITLGNNDFFFEEDESKEITLDFIYSNEFNLPKIVKLNDKYNAIIKDGYIKVGCQEITFDKVEELYEAIKN